jgi:hypothetical protein
MKRVWVAALLTIGMTVAAQAGTYTFNFNSLADNGGTAAVETYMEGIYGGGSSAITVWAHDEDGDIVSHSSPLGNDNWLKVDGGQQSGTGEDGLKISFNSVKIISASFDWASLNNQFVAEGDGVPFFSHSSDDGIDHGNTSYTFAGPVTTLYFHDHGQGWVGIDNLVVTTAGGTPAVPAPAGLLLVGLGTTLVGWLRKRRAA